MNITLNHFDYASLAPLLILLFGSLLVLLVESFKPRFSKRYSAYITLLTLGIALFATFFAPKSENPLLTPWIRYDLLAQLFTVFFLCIGIGVTLLASSFFDRFASSRGEYYFLLLSAIFGLILVGASADFLTLFLGIETLSISTYVLCGYIKKWTFSHEASIKYFFMGALGTAFLLYGIALLYGALGTTSFGPLLESAKQVTGAQQTLFLSGIALITLGLGFKAAIVPFHVWAPDVYDGAPTPVTALMAVGTKVGAFAAFAVVFLVALDQFNPIWNQSIAWLAIPTLIYANFVALKQNQLRRFFAYSGISHAGFMLIPFASGTEEAMTALLFYLIVYAIATMGAFAILSFLDKNDQGVVLEDLSGLFWRSPGLSTVFSLCLLTLGGIPPTMGFFAKFYVFQVAFRSGNYALIIVGLLTSVIAAYYYLRFVSVMFTEALQRITLPLRSWPAAIVGSVSFALILFFSCFPAPLLNLLETITS